jgi:Ta0938
LKLNYRGCAICDSTWGNVWEYVEGQRMFFCCDLCLVQFRGLVERIKRDTGWDHVDELEVAGDRRGRTCMAKSGSRSARFTFAFNSEGSLRRFGRQDAGSGGAGAPP